MKPSSRLLIDEQPLQVLPSLACKIGLNRATFLQQLHYWLQKPGAHERDGKRWIYNTAKEWHEQFPFWTEEAIRKIVNQLREKGLIETTSRYNKRRADKTLWYTINYDAVNKLYDEPPDKSTVTLNPPDKSTEPPDKSTDVAPDKSTERYQESTENNNRESLSGEGKPSGLEVKAVQDSMIKDLHERLRDRELLEKRPLTQAYKKRLAGEIRAYLNTHSVADIWEALDHIVFRWRDRALHLTDAMNSIEGRSTNNTAQYKQAPVSSSTAGYRKFT